jgi:flagellin-like protein
MNKTIKKIKAVSPIVATIILIIITIIAGIIVYFYVTGILAGGATNVSLKISGGAFAPGGGTTVFVTLTIRNDGNVPVKLNTLIIESPALGVTEFILPVASALLGLDTPPYSFDGKTAFTFTGQPVLAAGQSVTVQYKYALGSPATGASTIIRIIGLNTATGQTVGFLATIAINPA